MSEPILVLLICADRDAAGRLAGVIQGRGHRVVATPYGPSAMARAAEAALIVVDRVDGPVPPTSVVARMKGTNGVRDVPLLAIAQSDQVEEIDVQGDLISSRSSHSSHDTYNYGEFVWFRIPEIG